jgi:hypothetical protein
LYQAFVSAAKAVGGARAPRVGTKRQDVIVDAGVAPNHYEIVNRGGVDTGLVNDPKVVGDGDGVPAVVKGYIRGRVLRCEEEVALWRVDARQSGNLNLTHHPTDTYYIKTLRWLRTFAPGREEDMSPAHESIAAEMGKCLRCLRMLRMDEGVVEWVAIVVIAVVPATFTTSIGHRGT